MRGPEPRARPLSVDNAQTYRGLLGLLVLRLQLLLAGEHLQSQRNGYTLRVGNR